MNYYWIIAGICMLMGGALHTILGEKKVISVLKSLKDSNKVLTNEQFNLIRWFWYLGSYISFWVGVIALVIGVTDDVFDNEIVIAKLLASLMFGFSVVTSSLVIALNPKSVAKLAQVLILLAVTVMLWLGAV